MAAAGVTKKMIRMMASDGKQLVVEEAVAMKSQVIRHMIEDDCAEDVIPIPIVSSFILSKVFKYCEKHVDNSFTNIDDLMDFDNKFVDVDVDTLYDIIAAADYLEVKDLLSLIGEKVVQMRTGKSKNEIRQIFKIEDDSTTEEEDDSSSEEDDSSSEEEDDSTTEEEVINSVLCTI